jgi:hypothetical protein
LPEAFAQFSLARWPSIVQNPLVRARKGLSFAVLD